MRKIAGYLFLLVPLLTAVTISYTYFAYEEVPRTAVLNKSPTVPPNELAELNASLQAHNLIRIYGNADEIDQRAAVTSSDKRIVIFLQPPRSVPTQLKGRSVTIEGKLSDMQTASGGATRYVMQTSYVDPQFREQ